MGDITDPLGLGSADPLGDAVGKALGIPQELTNPVTGTKATLQMLGLMSGTDKPSKTDTPGDQNLQTVSIQSAQANVNIVYGQTRVGGVFAFYGLSGTNNDYLWFVLAVACHEVQGMQDLIIDGTLIQAAQIDGSGNVIAGKYAGLVQVFYHTGSASQTVDTNLDAAFTEWTTAFTGAEVAYLVVKFTRDADVFSSVPQQVACSVTGKKIYDPRLDTTAGGSGSQRANNPATWTWSENAALVTRDYLTDSKTRGCRGWPSSIFDDSVTIATANSCDELVTYNVSGVPTQQTRYAIGGVINAGNDYRSNLLLMLTAMNGWVDEVSGKYHIKCGVYEAPVKSIDHTWARTGISIQAGQDKNYLYNAVRGSFTDAQQDYQSVPFHSYTNSTYETADGGRWWKDIDLSLLSDQYRSQRVATLYGRQSRNQQVIVFPMDIRGIQFALGDALTVTIPRNAQPSGYYCNAKVFRIVSIDLILGPEIGFDLTLREDSSTAYSWAAADAFTVTVPSTPGAAAEVPPAPTSTSLDDAPDGVWIYCIPPPPDQYSFIEVWSNTSNTFVGATFRGQFRDTDYHYKNKSKPNFFYFLRARKGSGSAAHYSTVVSLGSITGGKSSTTTETETTTFLTPNSSVTYTSLVGDSGTWRTLATLPGDGSGKARGTFMVHVGFLSSPASPGWTFRVGVSSNGVCSAKLIYVNNDSSIYSNVRLRQNATSGDVSFQLLQATASVVVATVHVWPLVGSYDTALGPPVATANVTAGTGTNILGSQPLSGLIEAFFHSVAANHYDDQSGVHTRLGLPCWDTDAQIASIFRNPALIGPGYATSYYTGLNVTPHPTSLNFSACTLHNGDETSSYSSSSVSGLANSTNYHCYFQDKTMAGGAVTLHATTSSVTVSNNRINVYICDATTQTAGGTGGGGGVIGCVSVKMWMNRKITAKHTEVGYWVDCADNFKSIGRRAVHKRHLYTEPCSRLVAKNGAALVCSNTTPFTLSDGSSVFAPEMLGKDVLTDNGVSEIVELTDAGTQPVLYMGIGGISFYAGEDPNNRMVSHNTVKP